MGPERGPGRLGTGRIANRQLCPRPLPFPWQRAAMAKVKRGLLLSICARMQPRSHNASESQHRRKMTRWKKRRESVMQITCTTVPPEYLTGRSVPRFAIHMTSDSAANRARGRYWRYISGTSVPCVDVSAWYGERRTGSLVRTGC